MLVTVPKWYICKKKIHNNYKIMQKHQKDSLEIDMIKNLAPLTYVKSLWLRGTTIWVIIVFCSTCETTRTGSLRSKKKKKQPKKLNRYSTKQYLLHLFIWSPYNLQEYQIRKLFGVTISGDQKVTKHGENLGSKLTNHKMMKFPERSDVYLFSLQEALCFYLSVIGYFLKKFDILCSQ